MRPPTRLHRHSPRHYWPIPSLAYHALSAGGQAFASSACTIDLDSVARLSYCPRPMARHRYALVMLIAAALCCAVQGQTSLAPEAGVLSLKNGQIIEGNITRAGDYYIVTKGEGSELRLKTDEVEAFCATLLEAYEFKERHLSGLSARSHLELAKWCLRHGLYDKCAEQLAAAEHVEPGHPQIAELQTRLKLIVETTQPPAPASNTAAGIAPDELEKAVRALPKASVEKFGAIVQPILLNRCGANQCHGPNAK